jgi:protein transport protein SEC61 subunit gamma-like protein
MRIFGFDPAEFISQSKRVLSVATRPRRKEFQKIAKVTGAGIVLIGVIGIVLSFVFEAIDKL